MIHSLRQLGSVLAVIAAFIGGITASAAAQGRTRGALPARIDIRTGWQLQDVAKVPQANSVVSSAAFQPQGWYKATVPGTVLTSLVNDGVYPEPLYGENDLKIPESLNKTSYWYRTELTIPKNYAHHQVWLHFDGANYSSQVWVNGSQVGTFAGAFIRGTFDITKFVKPGRTAVIAVRVSPQPHPGVPHNHTIANGLGKNGGITAIDGPTFLSTVGWDWLNAVRDRDTGLWRKVWLSASGPVLVKNPLIRTNLPLPSTATADITVSATVQNTSAHPQKGELEGSFGDIHFSQKVRLKPNSRQLVTFDPQNTPVLHMDHPKLWWPNGYGPQNLYTMHLRFVQHGRESDASDTTFGIRKITYGGMKALTISVNGVKIFIRGGDWGLDEAMKRIPRARLDAEIHMHALANLNMIRNWVGQSTSEEFYELCDKYGILVWDEFFQPNPADGPNPDNLQVYLANVRDKILRYRNHPSIALWCARNEGYPPPAINAALQKMIPELDPDRLYQPSSTAGRGVMSGGPYYWREPKAFYVQDAPFKTETGSVSIPTIESIHAMMPKKDWEVIDNDWAMHDLAKGAQEGDQYPYVLAARYGRIANLADFVRKGQMMNYEAYRAMYEGRNAYLFKPDTGILTWMSNPAQPSFVWQLYAYDLEPNSSLFAVKSASELVHIQMDEANDELQVINNLPHALSGYTAHVQVISGPGFRETIPPSGAPIGYHLDLWQDGVNKKIPVSGPADTAIDLGKVPLPRYLPPVYFVRLDLLDPQGKVVSRNLYWKPSPSQGSDLSPMQYMPVATLNGTISREDVDGRLRLKVTLTNPDKSMALMVHLQLRDKATNKRILPVFYSDNYIWIAHGESRTITISASSAALHGDEPLVVVDGWNVKVKPTDNGKCALALNRDAQVSNYPATGLPMITAGLEGKGAPPY